MAADQGDARAQWRLAVLYKKGNGVPQDWGSGAAVPAGRRSGPTDAQLDLGVLHFHGLGMPKDLEAAVAWFRMAAEQRNVLAEFNLGRCYARGSGVEQSLVTAAHWFRLAAAQGHGSSQVELGEMYATGSRRRAIGQAGGVLVQLAADAGLARGQFNLGVFYASGRGVTQSDAKAIRWYRLAVEQGYAAACNNLGQFYENGRSVEQSDTEAVRLYRFAADAEHSHGQCNLARMYELGAASRRPIPRLCCGIRGRPTRGTGWRSRRCVACSRTPTGRPTPDAPTRTGGARGALRCPSHAAARCFVACRRGGACRCDGRRTTSTADAAMFLGSIWFRCNVLFGDAQLFARSQARRWTPKAPPSPPARSMRSNLKPVPNAAQH